MSNGRQVVAIVTDRWDERGGGRERYVSELAAFLTEQGFGVDVVCRHEACGAAPPPEVRIHTVGGPGVLGDVRLRMRVGAYRARHPLRSILSARPCAGATHYQLHSGIYERALAGERASMESAIRRALFRPATRVNLRRQWLLREEARLFADRSGPRLMVFSRALAQELEERLGVARSRITMSRPGVDVMRFARAGGRNGSKDRSAHLRLLFVAHNFVLKGLTPALASLARARAAGVDATLTVVGDGPIRRFQATARALGLGERVRFEGVADPDHLAHLYGVSDALLHPAFYDPFPRVISEALTAGCPVITTRGCGAAELVSHDEQGFVIGDPRDVDALVGALVALRDPQCRQRLSQNAARLSTHAGHDAHAHFRDVIDWLELH